MGWRGLSWKARKHALRLPLLPIGPRERPRLADSFFAPGSGARPRGIPPGSLDQRSEEWPLCEGKSGALGVRLVRPPPRGEGNCGVPTFGPPEGGEGSKGVGGSGRGGRGLGFVGLRLAFRGGASGRRAQWRPLDVFPPSLEAASRQREEVSSAYMKVCEMVMGMGGLREGVEDVECRAL